MGALSHIKVLDLSRVLAGPWACQLLADLGAEVIKVENPDGGDDTRGWGPPYMRDNAGQTTKESAYFLCANRGKQSVCLDMKTKNGQKAIRQLATQSDVVIENFKVDTMAKYGLDYGTLSKANPRLVYCSITGFGQTGPLKTFPGYDIIVQAMSGLMSITGNPDGTEGAGPQKVGVALTDIMTGLYSVIGILAALSERDQSGQGQYVDLALLDVAIACMANQAANYLVGGMIPKRLGNMHPNIVPYQSFVAKDGDLVVAVGNDIQFRSYMEVLGLSELVNDERFATNRQRVKHRDLLVPLLQAKMLDRDRQEWMVLLGSANVPCSPINTIAEAFQTPQVQSREMQVKMPHILKDDLQLLSNPIKLSRTPVEYHRPPPILGQHTDEVLSSLKAGSQHSDIKKKNIELSKNIV